MLTGAAQISLIKTYNPSHCAPYSGLRIFSLLHYNNMCPSAKSVSRLHRLLTATTPAQQTNQKAIRRFHVHRKKQSQQTAKPPSWGKLSRGSVPSTNSRQTGKDRMVHAFGTQHLPEQRRLPSQSSRKSFETIWRKQHEYAANIIETCCLSKWLINTAQTKQMMDAHCRVTSEHICARVIEAVQNISPHMVCLKRLFQIMVLMLFPWNFNIPQKRLAGALQSNLVSLGAAWTSRMLGTYN